jgi:hypothetical protein
VCEFIFSPMRATFPVILNILLYKNIDFTTCVWNMVWYFWGRSRLAQSVYCLATDWTTGRSGFNPRQRQEDFSSNLSVQTGSGAHPASCPIGTGGPFTRR